MRHNAIGRYRSSEVSLELDAPLDMRVHLGLEKPNARPTSGLGAIECTVCAPDQLVTVNTIIRSYGDTNSDTEFHCHILDNERLCNGCRDAPRKICGIIKGVDFGHDDRKLVPTNSGKKCFRAYED
jgi:hypothetical protein